MATLMTFIDPELSSASIKWWDKATKTKVANTVVENVREWRKDFVIRREKSVIDALLPNKTVTITQVGATQSELVTYNYYDKIFAKAMDKFKTLIDSNDRTAIKRKKEIFAILMACMSSMRMSLIHPIIPKGREVTIQFSPSRRNSAQVSNIFIFDTYKKGIF